MGSLVTAYMLYLFHGTVSVIGVARVAAYVTLMVGVCMLASIVPLRRALQIPPSHALKSGS
jgi:ABC-type lipoprotein release transport system permease subunit